MQFPYLFKIVIELNTVMRRDIVGTVDILMNIYE